MDPRWTIDVTDADIRAARDAWRAARDGGAPPERVEAMLQSYERLVRTQGRQLGEALRTRNADSDQSPRGGPPG